MREILFKAKTEKIVRTYNNGLDDGVWVQGYLRCDCGMWLIYQFEYDRADQVAYEVNPETICQYTGLTDKNGNKIWENDVVRKSDINAIGYGRVRNCKVSFDKMGYWLLTTDYGDGYWLGSFDASQLEVIGTIFDNPELLENE